MSNEKLTQQLGKLKEACAKWEKELSVYSKWAIENDGVLSANEIQVINAINSEIQSIKNQIAKIETAKGIEPKNKLGITEVEVKDKLANFFAAFDKITVVVDNVKVEVETPYFMNNGGGGGYVKVGKGSPKDIQKWLQDKINSGAVKSKNPQELRDYMKQNRIGVDCSGFVSQALNHLADKEGDMDFGSDDVFNPGGRNSTSFGPAGKEFTKISPENVKIGDTLYYDNPKAGGVNHIRIVGDVRKENGVVYYTLFESAGSTGPRKMEWKFDAKLQEFVGNKWVIKSNEEFYRWKSLEMQAPSSDGAGQGQVQDQQNQQNNASEGNAAQPSSTLSESVGNAGKNKKADVLLVQELLNKKGASLVIDGDCGNKTIAAIEKFQKDFAGFSKPDGLISPGGKTWKALIGNGTQNNSSQQNSGGQHEENNGNSNPSNNNQTGPSQNTPVEEILAPNSAIKQSVGSGGKNDVADVLKVKQLLNKFGYNLSADGNSDNSLITAIKDFQSKYRGSSNPDGKVDPGGATWNSLIGIGRIQGQLLSMASQFGIEPAVILAIQQIESGGNGFLPDGRPKILFEGHVFWSQLKKIGKNPETLTSGNENILYPSWDKSKYKGGAAEYDRLENAKKIDEIAALKSASWGEFQIMGFNHSSVGYADVKTFVEAMHIPNGASLKAMLEFCKNKNLLKHVSGNSKDWAKFAYGYNGSGYAQNQYDVKLAAAYERFKKI